MKCDCADSGDMDMQTVAGWDDPSAGYAYNVRQCVMCGLIIIQHVWGHKKIVMVPVVGLPVVTYAKCQIELDL